MPAHRRRRRRDADGPKFHPLSFGGWGDYKTWAEHQFLPKPVESVPDVDTADGDARDGDVTSVDVPQEPQSVNGGHHDAGVRDDGPLGVDSLIWVTPEGAMTAHSPTLGEDYRRVFALCRQPTPVIEIAARLRMPIGAALVLISDAIAWNQLKALPRAQGGEAPSLEVILRVYDGLRQLR
ncbi:DUF742 domain-containing protein [Nonomuraea sp. NPDC050404]|uniref:DUF742 domain-containing protein n=1 Tax=Nonomuraea sp. NPDC050404 TaxID=3155783 RepID=UPI0033FC08D4